MWCLSVAPQQRMLDGRCGCGLRTTSREGMPGSSGWVHDASAPTICTWEEEVRGAGGLDFGVDGKRRIQRQAKRAESASLVWLLPAARSSPRAILVAGHQAARTCFPSCSVGPFFTHNDIAHCRLQIADCSTAPPHIHQLHIASDTMRLLARPSLATRATARRAPLNLASCSPCATIVP